MPFERSMSSAGIGAPYDVVGADEVVVGSGWAEKLGWLYGIMMNI